jgi:RNA polymerase subunit RPABC4/transcription elongation factor Spt4
MRRSFIAVLCLFLIPTTLFAEDVNLEWSHKVGDVFEFKLKSIIEVDGRAESSIHGQIQVTESAGKTRAKGIMTFTKIYAIKSNSGSGFTVHKEKLDGKKVRCSLGTNGQIFVDGSDLGRIQKEFEDFNESTNLSAHFKGLFFKLPVKSVAKGKAWKTFHDNCTFEMTVTSIKDEKGRKIAIINGSPQAPDDETVNGYLKIQFDMTNGYIISLKQRHKRSKTMGTIIKTTNESKYERTLTITKRNVGTVKEKVVEPKTPTIEPIIQKLACPKCKKVPSQGTKFCPDDGFKIGPVAPTKLKCSKCSKEVKEGTKFCPNDGTKIGG